MNTAQRITCAFVLLAATALAAPAQVPIGTIESEGVATVDAAPDYAEFWLHRVATADAVYKAAAAVLTFPDELDRALKASELEPDEMVISEVSIPEASQGLAYVSAILRFPMTTISTAEDGIEQFAVLCDTLRQLSQALGCKLEGPILQVRAKEELQDSAIARAVEQALAPAEAAAKVMQTRIHTVQHVEVLSVAWNRELESKAVQPQVRRVTCTARVRVLYGFSAG